MFKRVAAILILVTILLSGAVFAQHIYLRMYWIVGDIADPDNKGIEGRWVCFYPAEGTAIAYSDDLAGTVGTSGRATQFMINAYEDQRMVLDPALPVGSYKCATVKGYVNGVLVDDYGANPVDVTITGNGYDVVPRLTLVQGGGIEPPAERPNPFAPKIENIRFNDRKYQPGLVSKPGEKFIISARPKISAKITSVLPLLPETVAMTINEGTAAVKTYRVTSAMFTGTKSLAEGDLTEINFLYDFTKETSEPLPESKDPQIIRIKASNAAGASIESCSVYIQAGDLELVGDPIAFPSPLHIKTERKVTLQYGLSKDANIEIYVFDISARIIKKWAFSAGMMGGQAGGTANPNKVEWDLISDQGTLTGTGIYLFNIVDKDRSRVLGKGKITIVP